MLSVIFFVFRDCFTENGSVGKNFMGLTIVDSVCHSSCFLLIFKIILFFAFYFVFCWLTWSSSRQKGPLLLSRINLSEDASKCWSQSQVFYLSRLPFLFQFFNIFFFSFPFSFSFSFSFSISFLGIGGLTETIFLLFLNDRIGDKLQGLKVMHVTDPEAYPQAEQKQLKAL